MKRAREIYITFLKIFFRDKGNIIFIFFFNAFLMIVFGLTLEDKYNLNVDLGYFQELKTENASLLLEHFDKQSNVTLKRYVSRDSLINDVKNGLLVAGIEINPASNIQSSLNIRVFGDPSRKMWLQFIEPGLQLAAIESNTILNQELNRISIESEYISSKNLKYFDFIFPGLLIFSIMQIGLSGGLTLLTQRKNENLKRLKITPLKKWEFLLGYSTSYLSIMVLQNIFYVALAIIIFNYSFSGSPLIILGIILLSSLIFISIGILLSNFVSSVENGNNLINFISFPAAFLCGIFMPIDTLPKIVQFVANIHPLTHLANVMRGVANYGNPLNRYTITLGLMLVLLLLIAATSIRTFRWQEKEA
ncbi:ABC transporter permease [Muricauda sp. MAR_2010_75]|uniref:ABC transporter permease n=1 Tax=Allomuricauda sp. MAR_2010_75 TaxID=1250232 RepID=UPI0005612645|nr:ABC transporter permease [Muricauda sp. MAR_2010_75]